MFNRKSNEPEDFMMRLFRLADTPLHMIQDGASDEEILKFFLSEGMDRAQALKEVEKLREDFEKRKQSKK